MTESDGIPLCMGTTAQFTALRGLLEEATYTEAEICARQDQPSIYDFRTLHEGRPASTVRDTHDLLVRFFMDSKPVAASRTRKLLGAYMTTLLELGLLRHLPDGRLQATVLLYPTRGLYIVSDSFHARATGGVRGLRPDIVYPAITGGTRHFIDAIPDSPCDDFLELCAGTGIAALVASPHVRHAWAADITERSTRFAAFNAALNGIDNVTAVRGDLYEPVAGRTFDRIVAHPPFVPASRPRFIYRDGGNDGEQITRRIIADLPDHLRPGGLFVCTCAATDRGDATLEERVRSMLGARASEFDIIVVTRSVTDREAYCAGQSARGRAREAKLLLRTFRALDVENLVLGTIAIVRHQRAANPMNVRRPVGGMTVGHAIEHVVRWDIAGRSPAALNQLLDLRPAISPHVRRHIEQSATDDGWILEQCQFSTDRPFPITLAPTDSGPDLLDHFGGRHTVRELARRLRSSGRIPATATDELFAEMVRSLLAGGFLEIREP